MAGIDGQPSIIPNILDYNGPKEGKSVMNNIRAAELDYERSSGIFH